MGGILGYWYIPEFNDANLDIHLVNSEEQNFVKLAKNRIDFALTGQPVAERIIRELPAELRGNISALTKPESKDAFHILVSKTYPDHEKLNRLFAEGLRILIESGHYLNLLQRYNLSSEYAISADDI